MKKLFLPIILLPMFLFSDIYETPKEMLEFAENKRLGYTMKPKNHDMEMDEENFTMQESDSYGYLSASYLLDSSIKMYGTALGFAFNDWIDTRLFYKNEQLANNFVAHKVGNLYGLSVLNFTYFKLNVTGDFSIALITKAKTLDKKVLSFGYGVELELIPIRKLRMIVAVKRDIMHIDNKNQQATLYGMHIKLAPFL